MDEELCERDELELLELDWLELDWVELDWLELDELEALGEEGEGMDVCCCGGCGRGELVLHALSIEPVKRKAVTTVVTLRLIMGAPIWLCRSFRFRWLWRRVSPRADPANVAFLSSAHNRLSAAPLCQALSDSRLAEYELLRLPFGVDRFAVDHAWAKPGALQAALHFGIVFFGVLWLGLHDLDVLRLPETIDIKTD